MLEGERHPSRSKSWRFKLVLLAVGVIFGGLVVELGARLLTYDIHQPGMYVEDPEVGYALAPDFEGHLSRPEFKVPVTTGREGFRSGDVRERTAETLRVFVLGDSQAWGFGVHDDETFSARLEGLLAEGLPGRDVQVVNGGVPGYGTADQLAMLRSRGPTLAPDVVVLQFLSVNDFRENRSPAAEWAAVRGGMLGHRADVDDPDESFDYPFWVEAKNWLKRESRAARLAFDSAGYLAVRFGLVPPSDVMWGEDYTDEDAKRAVELLVEVSETARALSAEPLLLYSTGQVHVIQDDVESPRSSEVVAEAARLSGARYIDATAELRARDDRLALYFKQNGHWTAQGHLAIAELIAPHVVEAVSAGGALEADPG